MPPKGLIGFAVKDEVGAVIIHNYKPKRYVVNSFMDMSYSTPFASGSGNFGIGGNNDSYTGGGTESITPEGLGGFKWGSDSRGNNEELCFSEIITF